MGGVWASIPPHAAAQTPRQAVNLGAWMGGKVDFAQLRLIEMRVQLGRGDIGMPQNLLQSAQVGATGEHMRRE